MSRIASLPMYDLAEVRSATDALWRALSRSLRARGVERVPDLVAREPDPCASWLSPLLLLSQTCGFPLTHALKGKVRVVGTPCYTAPGCEGPTYRSLLVVGAGGPAAADDLPPGPAGR